MKKLPDLEVSPRNLDLKIDQGTPKFNNQAFDFSYPCREKPSKAHDKPREYFAQENYRSESNNF